jgi:Cof subfamily protein (haloacid dehalogenase superfamily)
MNQERHPSPYRLALIDLDDTLLGPDKRVSPDNRAALDRLRAAGIQVAVASGRHHKNVVKLNAVGGAGWIVSSNGSSVRHEPSGDVLIEANIDPKLIGIISKRAYASGFSVIAYHSEGAFIERETEWTDIYAQKAGWIPTLLDFRSLDPEGFQKILWSHDPALVTRLAPVLQQEFVGRVNVLITNPELIEFFASTANKATGAQALAESLGFEREQTLAFGDGSNDIELMQWAGLSVAMHHGTELARSAARHVSPPGPPESAFARSVDLALNTRIEALAA